jgi:hypothetical protein
MTPQELFDRVWAGAKAQGFAKSEDATGDIGCAYRSDGGLRCNAGHLIPDDKYSSEMEGHSVADESVWCVLGPIVGSDNEHLLDDLQGCHDYTDDPKRHEQALRDTADQYGLTVPA